MVEQISFKLTKPDRSKVEGKENGLAPRVVNEKEGLTTSLMGVSIEVSKKIEMTNTPKEKQKPGLYKIEIYNADKLCGILQCQIAIN